MTIRRRPPKAPPRDRPAPHVFCAVPMTAQQQRRQDLQCLWLQSAIDAQERAPENDAERLERLAA